MKLTGISLSGEYGVGEIDFAFNNAFQNGSYLIKNTTGLDAQDIFYSANNDGNGKTYSAFLRDREIVIQLSMNPNFSIGESYSSLRDGLYRLIFGMPDNKLFIRLKNGTQVVAQTDCLMTKIESDQFAKVQDITLTLKCNEAIFRGPEKIVFTEEDCADFLWYDWRITDDLSTAKHGVSFEFEFTPPYLNYFSLTIDNNFSFGVNPPHNSTWLAGDIIRINNDYDEVSKKTLKQVLVISNGQWYRVYDQFGYGVTWPYLRPGENRFRFQQPAVVKSVSYWPTYLGV